jgi:hypothetical protein
VKNQLLMEMILAKSELSEQREQSSLLELPSRDESQQS